MKISNFSLGVVWAGCACLAFIIVLSIISTDGLSTLAVIFSGLCLLLTLISLGVWIDGAARAIINQAKE